MGPILTALIGPLGNVVNTVIDRVVPDKAAAEKAKIQAQLALLESSTKGELAQIDLNKIEAANTSIFVSGWRPFIGWVCGSALAYQFVLAPISMWVASWVGFPVPLPPKLDDVLWELMFGMLGMGTLRTVEKWKGVAAK